MAVIGVSKPKYAIYNYDEETKTITYTSGGTLGKATEVDVSINTSEDNNLYADNGIAETDRQFTDGTLTLGTDHLSQAVSQVILGAKERALEEIPGVSDADVKELVYDDDMANPYLGQGFIIKTQRNNKTAWRAVIFTKTMFNVPDEAATTQGEQIEWQTPSLVAAILRDDSETHTWKREATFSTEAQAEAYLNFRLGIKEASGGGSGGGEEPQALRAALAKGAGGDKV